jgi:hypothetical protein
VTQFNNTPLKRPVGRPLAASEAQCAQVLSLRRKGTSLREIAEETNLSFQTVRTIVGRKRGTERTTRLRRTNEPVEDAIFVSLAVRLAKALLRFAHIDPENIRPVEVPITQRELGDMIGFSRENTNKQLRAWEKRHWVKLTRGNVRIVDPGALLRLSENG